MRNVLSLKANLSLDDITESISERVSNDGAAWGVPNPPENRLFSRITSPI